MDRKKIILPTLKFKGSQPEDLQIRLGFEEKKSLLINDDRDVLLNLSEQYQKERNECNQYKIFGKLRMVFRNLYLGTTQHDYMKNRLALVGYGVDGDGTNWAGYLPYNEFAFIRDDIYRETTIKESLSTLDNFDGFTMENIGFNEYQPVTSINANKLNWNLYLSYVYSGVTNFPMRYTLTGNTEISFNSGNGIPFRVSNTSTSYILTSPVIHGMSQGEYIIINNKPYYINSVGNEYHDSEKYVINILKNQLSGQTLSLLITGKRCIDNKNITGSTSHYYVHKHKTLTTVDDYIMEKMGFETPIFEDEKKLLFETISGDNDVLVVRNRMEAILYDFKNPFTLSGITNNLGYTPTDLYITVIFRNGNGVFNYPPKVGYKFNQHNTWIDNYYDDNNTVFESSLTFGSSGGEILDAIGLNSPYDEIENIETANGELIEVNYFKTGNPLPKGSTLYGAFVEYNPKEMKERVISESSHKIIASTYMFDHNQTDGTSYSGATITNPVGLFYQPHYRVKIRELSPYTEELNTNQIDNLPENAKYFSAEKTWRWRDLYDLGYVDPDGYGVNYPYMNNIHYIHNDINFYVKNETGYLNKQDGISNFNSKYKKYC